jgi:putative DNA-invertase from lambdoid prophage Rac
MAKKSVPSEKSTATTASRAFGYCRVSTVEQTKGESLTVQRQLIAAQAKRLGKSLVKIYTDEGVSGSMPLQKRPHGRELLEAVLHGEITKGDTIIASKLDRMFRSAHDALTVSKTFKKRAISLSLLDIVGGEDVTADGMATAFFSMAAVFAQLEHDRIGERITEAKAVQKRKGLALGGDRPFGYRIGQGRKLVAIPKEQEAIQLIRRLRKKKHALRKIAHDVLAQYPGLKLSHTTVASVLRRHP